MSAEWHRGCQLAERASEARTVFKETLLAHDTAIRLCGARAGEREREREAGAAAVIQRRSQSSDGRVKDHITLLEYSDGR